jgi:hypothetical protein
MPGIEADLVNYQVKIQVATKHRHAPAFMQAFINVRDPCTCDQEPAPVPRTAATSGTSDLHTIGAMFSSKSLHPKNQKGIAQYAHHFHMCN